MARCTNHKWQWSLNPRSLEANTPTYLDRVCSTCGKYDSYIFYRKLTFEGAMAAWKDTYGRAPRIKTEQPRDSQKARLYKWENETIFTHWTPDYVKKPVRVSYEEAIAFIGQVAHDYGLPMPEIKESWGKGKSYYQHFLGRDRIVLAKGWGMQMPILIHEVAHFVHYHYYKGTPYHGPEYAGVYLELLQRYADRPVDIQTVAKAAKQYKVEIK
jgi:hypothetical protein